ncbi:Rrf2 family transcriptional regulator [Pseudoalteromonas luteoviolacea]|uniref:Rrf2 family transcriptional regulator n=1 Tax=Pseudoalteromonas luteoviolacea TaxID=43657 RepID=UPI0022AB70CC|nr:Rrf2 family transcriptional regulator [Pseudoalteromonas luteoviolacea]
MVAHACAILALLPPKRALSKESLAEFLGVPAPYLAKQLQALSRAGIVLTHRGAKGGYRLAKSADLISLWDITASVEGTTPSFRCTEVRRNGPCGASEKECAGPCHIASAFARAEVEYRNSLAQVKLIDLVAAGASDATENRKQDIGLWLEQHTTDVA